MEDKNEKDQLTFRLPTDLNQKLKNEANRIGTSQNSYILILIDIGLKVIGSLEKRE
jgi:predicted DNA-binding protein